MLRRSLLRGGLTALGAALLLAHTLSAQGGVLRGQVMGANGPVPNLPVALHRVLPDGSGTMMDQTTTDSAGQFQFKVNLAGDTAVYFAATRIGNDLFVGPAIKGVLPTGEYVIDAGPNAEAIPIGGAAMPGTNGLASGPEANEGGGWGHAWLGLLALMVVGVVVVLLTWSRRPHLSAEERRRSRLVRLATFEEDYADRLENLSAAERADYEERRSRLRDELLGR